MPYWDDTTTTELVVEGWDNVSQIFINEKTSNIVDRLNNVIEAKGQMTGH